MSQKRQAPWPHSFSEKMVFAILYVPSFLILSMPRSWQMFFGRGFGHLAYWIAGYRRQVVIDNLKIAFPEWTDAEREKTMREHYMHLGQLVIEYLWSPALTRKKGEKLFVLEGAEHYDKALAGGKGALILGSHAGSGDMGIIACQLMGGYPMTLVGKRTRVHWVTRMLFGLREIHGVRALPEEQVVTDIFRALRRNELVIFVMDQFMGPPKGTETYFFGKLTGTVTSLGVFAERTGVPVVPVWTYRDEQGRVHVVIEPELKLDTKDPVEMTQKYNDVLEDFARRCPVQWFWVHQRWKDFVRHSAEGKVISINGQPVSDKD